MGSQTRDHAYDNIEMFINFDPDKMMSMRTHLWNLEDGQETVYPVQLWRMIPRTYLESNTAHPFGPRSIARLKP